MCCTTQSETALLSDSELMAGLSSEPARRDSEELFAEVFARYHERVFAWCYRVSGNRDSACDLTQEVFLKAWRHRQSFRGDSSLSTWLYAISRNHCLTALRRHSTTDVPLDLVSHAHLRPLFQDEDALNPGKTAEREELCRRMLQLMARTLDPLEVRVMTLHYGYEVPLATITRELGLKNPSGAKAYIVNARRKLQAFIQRRGRNVALAARRDGPYWAGTNAA